MHGNQLNARPPNLQVRAAVDRHIRLEAAHVVETKALAEELLAEVPWSIEIVSYLFLIVAPGIEAQARIQGAEIFMASYGPSGSV